MKLNKNQINVVNYYKGNCCVIANAGSGKSSCVVARVQNLIDRHKENPNKILCVTFTKKSKDDLKSKLEKIISKYAKDINVETFHSLGYKIIRTKFNNHYTVSNNSFQYDDIIKNIIVNKMQIAQFEDKLPIAQIRFFISFQKNKLILPDGDMDYSCLDDIDFPTERLAEVYEHYESEKENKQILDFDDLMIKSYFILKDNSKILKMYQDKFDFINVDEFQDTSMCQIKLLQLISNKNNLMVVGDMKQSIYSWRGSDNDFIMNFENYFEKPDVLYLDTNYRSTDNIIGYSNEFAKQLSESKSTKHIDSIGQNINGLDVSFKVYPNEYDEAFHVATKIKELVALSEINFDDIMIIARTNAQLAKIEMVFYDNEVLSSGVSFFDKGEIKLTISYLKLALNINDNDSFEFLYSKPLRWLGSQFLKEVKVICSKNKYNSLYCGMSQIDRRNWRFKKGIDEIIKVISYIQKNKSKKPDKLIKYLRDILSIEDFYKKSTISENNDSTEVNENLNSLENVASKFSSLQEFITYVDKFNKERENKETDELGVKLTTIHSAKGLESKVCFIVGVSNDLLPHKRNKNVDEEKRLFYVAITRAKEELYISSILQYNIKNMTISSFLTNTNPKGEQ